MISYRTNHELGGGVFIVPLLPAVAERLVWSVDVRCVSPPKLIAIQKDNAQEPITEKRLSMEFEKKSSMPASSASEIQKI